MAETVALGDKAGEQGREADGEITRELIEPHGEPARFGADEIDLHDHRHRPREALIDAEQRVRSDDPAPAWPPANHERHRQADEPAKNQHMLAAVNIGKMPRDQICKGLDDAEAHDEREDGGGRSDLELLGTDQRDHGTLQPHHATDEGINEDEQRKLLPVRAQPESDARTGSDRLTGATRTHSAAMRPELNALTCAACGGAGGMSASIACRKAASSSIRNALL